MTTKQYALGIDFGSLSARALLVDLRTGAECACAVSEYAHAVMDNCLPSGQTLPADYALQHPQDYIDALCSVTRQILSDSGIPAGEIVGVTLDFTASTVLPVCADGTPLCFSEQYRDNPHAYVKMWKHHAAQSYADRLVRIAAERGEDFLSCYSGKVSGEWMIPKLWQILAEDEALYNDMDRFMEAGDWMVLLLTGNEVRSANIAGYKALWRSGAGYPSEDFFAALDPRLRTAVHDKLDAPVAPLGTVAGTVTEAAAAMTGLAAGTPVSVSVIDAHAAFPASGITRPGKLMMIMGTSNCLLTIDNGMHSSDGIFYVFDGILPGFYGYEAGQACFGDHFDWFVKNAVPAEYKEEATRRGISLHAYLCSLAEARRPGETGLLALDWWNGVRTDLMDEDLSGVMLGMTLTTKPEDIYRALLEAASFGARVVTDSYARAGVMLDEIYACGGIAKKNPLLMQILADVLAKPIHIVASDYAGALGCAMSAAVAGGYFRNLEEAARVMVKPPIRTYLPNPENTAIYDLLYAEYRRLHDFFADADSPVKRLRRIKSHNM